jgi:hypothetical protein
MAILAMLEHGRDARGWSFYIFHAAAAWVRARSVS